MEEAEAELCCTCTNPKCKKVCKRVNFISPKKKTGGRDWSSLVGQSLCDACVQQFWRTGSLEKEKRAPHVDWSKLPRECSNTRCPVPRGQENRRYLLVRSDTDSGGQDWSGLAGKVICRPCWQTFATFGTLERMTDLKRGGAPKPPPIPKRNPPSPLYLPTSSMHLHLKHIPPLSHTSQAHQNHSNPSKPGCTYAACPAPERGRKGDFVRIKTGKNSGGQDWSSIEGHVLCGSCYTHFYNNGTLERLGRSVPSRANLDAASSRKRKRTDSDVAGSTRHGPCTYASCPRPAISKYFIRIHEGMKDGLRGGGRDWTSLVGNVLCTSCYGNFMVSGTLDRAAGPLTEGRGAASRQADAGGRAARKAGQGGGRQGNARGTRCDDVEEGSVSSAGGVAQPTRLKVKARLAPMLTMSKPAGRAGEEASVGGPAASKRQKMKPKVNTGPGSTAML